jgi:hypothetical protein
MKRNLILTCLCLLCFQLSFPQVQTYSIPEDKLAKAHSLLKQTQDQEDSLESKIPSLSPSEIIRDLNYMLEHPNSGIMNYHGYYCGVLAIQNWLINTHPDVYTKTVLDLCFRGEAQIEKTGKTLKLPSHISKVDLTVSKIQKGKPIYESIDSASVSDFVLAVALTHQEKFLQKAGLLWEDACYYKESMGNFIFTNTMPWEMNDYFKFFGYNVEEKGIYKGIPRKEDFLFRLEKACKEGKLPILFENHLLTSTRSRNKIYQLIGAHYITLHHFNYDPELQTVSYSYWDYGSVKDRREFNRNKTVAYAKNLKQAARWQKRISRKPRVQITEKISVEHFFKALRGYWIVE